MRRGAVLDFDAARPAGRTGREDHVGEVGGPGRLRGRARGVARPRRVQDFRLRGGYAEPRLVDDDQGAAGVAEHSRDASRRIVGADGDVRRPGSHDAERYPDGIVGAAQTDGHAVTATDAMGREMGGEGGGVAFELAMGHPPAVRCLDGQCVRVARSSAGEELGDRGHDRLGLWQSASWSRLR